MLFSASTIRRLAGGAFFALILGATSAHGQTVLTEDFEVPVTSNYITYFAGDSIVTATNIWHITAQSVDLYNALARPEAAAYDGDQAVDLTGTPGDGVMHAAFPTTPGVVYRLVFHYARNNNIGSSVARAQVDILGSGTLLSAIVSHDPAQLPFSTYLTFDSTFIADGQQALLQFTSLSPSSYAGVTVDGIRVTVLGTSGVGQPGRRVGVDAILGVHPNPARGPVSIDYVTVAPGPVDGRVVDVRGRVVATLVLGEQSGGPHVVKWTAPGASPRDAAPGIYFFMLRTARVTLSRRFVLIR